MASTDFYDVVVIGVGSMGAAACYYLAAGGARVLGIEQFEITHDRGSHAGQSRIIRKAYFEHPDYVPLLETAYQNWKHLESITGEEIFIRTGLLYAGPPQHPIMQGVRLASNTYGLPLDVVSQNNRAAKYPAVHLPVNYDCILEPDAGFVTPEKAIRLYALEAKALGANIITGAKVLHWKKERNAFEVTTTAGIFHAAKLVITAGAWASKVMPGFSVPLQVTKQVLAWVQPFSPGAVALGAFPCWMIADEDYPGAFYGFPVLPEQRFGKPNGFKLALHYPGTPCDPDDENRSVPGKDEALLHSFLHKYFPGVFSSGMELKTCLYTNSPDEDFIIDYLPEYDKSVAIATGFSGHGFKFVSVVGQILGDMILKGGSTLPVKFLGLHRFK